MSSLADLATGAVQSIGRYFGVVSVIPSALLVVFVDILILSKSWTGSPDWSSGINEIAHPGLGGFVLLTLASLGVALALHPMQFAIVQFFEGYWGNSGPAQRLRIKRIITYQRLMDKLELQQIEADDQLVKLDELGVFNTHATAQSLALRAALMSLSDEAARIREASFPQAQSDAMPTRLGNVMRRFERRSGSQYELDAPLVFSHIMLVSPAEYVAYVNDQRQQLDLAIRMSFTSLIACIAGLCLLWRSGLWLLICLIPYAVGYLSYRGAVVLARQYGTAVNTVVDLSRFALYDGLKVPLPVNTAEERKSNKRLMELLRHNVRSGVTYVQHGAESRTQPPPAGG